ncbi:helix-turn-helix transcriptional regulator [Cellulomonas cellasea]|uniref:helix-turn-helix transcriptional regulator n=1 Tax=Cellulomonas cellasea TaxID=43670 RepID=UPI0025A3A988|nr:helix-turn-helix transcriptional regulator [Cellulomonas cellasea]MDM8083971.1 helix-turn-helix transcriptional regulator [Cellulomonas cellasea]
MTDPSSLGAYLRARRQLVRPEDVGLPTVGQRRVDGLRREEVAMLAGISSDYYLRLEQGRNHNPSAQVLESLARVLRLDDAATAYLLELAAHHQRRRRPRRHRPATVPTGIRQLVASIGIPAFVESRHYDVLAANPLVTAISPNIRVGQNRLRAIFLDPAEAALCPDFERARASMVAGFRESAGADVDDPRFVQIVGELSVASERFRQLWARHDVHPRQSTTTVIHHPQVGELTLHKERLLISGADGLALTLHHVAPGTEDAEKMALLASLATPTTSARSSRAFDASDA